MPKASSGCTDAAAPFLHPPCPMPGSLPVTPSATCGWRCQGYRPLAQSRSVFIALNGHDSTASLFAFSCNGICALLNTENPLLCMIILFLSMGEPGLKFPLDHLHLQETLFIVWEKWAGKGVSLVYVCVFSVWSFDWCHAGHVTLCSRRWGNGCWRLQLPLMKDCVKCDGRNGT